MYSTIFCYFLGFKIIEKETRKLKIEKFFKNLNQNKTKKWPKKSVIQKNKIKNVYWVTAAKMTTLTQFLRKYVLTP